MMAGWTSINKKNPTSKISDKNDQMMMGLMLSQKSGLDLMQNCDLPPPLKVFAGPPDMNRYSHSVSREHENDEIYIHGGDTLNQYEKLELLKALRLSQTRAREAEKRAAVLGKERDLLSNALLDTSSEFFAYRMWVKLLEIQLLQKRPQKQEMRFCCDDCGNKSSEREEEEEVGSMRWFMGWALCLGIAGVGLAVGCTYLF